PFKRSVEPSAFIDPLLHDFKNVRLAWLGDLNGRLAFESGVLDACTSVLPLFDDIGCDVESYVPPFNYDDLCQSWLDLRSHLFYRNNIQVLGDPQSFALIKPEAQWEFVRCEELSDEQVREANRIRADWRALLNGIFERYEY